MIVIKDITRRKEKVYEVEDYHLDRRHNQHDHIYHTHLVEWHDMSSSVLLRKAAAGECSGILKRSHGYTLVPNCILIIPPKKKEIRTHTPCFVPCPPRSFVSLFFGSIASHNRGDAPNGTTADPTNSYQYHLAIAY
jgi:hypothetical protein